MPTYHSCTPQRWLDERAFLVDTSPKIITERVSAVEAHGELAIVQGVAMMLVYACIGGFIATRLRLTPIVGFLAGGVLLGPFTPGPIGNDDVAHQLAELGVILLMFGVGLHFSVRDLMAVRSIAVPGAIGQSLIAVALTTGIALAWGWSLRAGLVLGIAVSVASTVVLIRALSDRHVLDSPAGRTAIGWLIVEDLMSVLVLVLLPLLATQDGNHLTVGHEESVHESTQPILLTLAITFGKLAVLVFLVFFIGKRLVSWALAQLEPGDSEAMFTLTVLVIALGIAVGANVAFEVSFALGAFSPVSLSADRAWNIGPRRMSYPCGISSVSSSLSRSGCSSTL